METRAMTMFTSNVQYCAKVMQAIINEYRKYCDISAIFNENLP